MTLKFGTWNVRTLLDSSRTDRPERRTALIARELKRYQVDIAALSETRFADKRQLTEIGGGYTFFWSGRPSTERRKARVDFAVILQIVNKLAKLPERVNDRLMTLQLPLGKKKNAIIISAYSPTMTNPDDVKDQFYEELDTIITRVPQADKLLGDFNARVGSDHRVWEKVIEKHGIVDRKIAEEFSRDLDAKLTEIPMALTNIEDQWASFRDTVYSVALEHLGPAKRKHQDWFDENSENIHNLLVKKRLMRIHQDDPSSVSQKAAFVNKRQVEQKKLRDMQDSRLSQMADEIQASPVLNADGSKLLTEKTQIL
ncbi:Craniofacial development protein 2 [Holothuria leucospilota]|uniref:Craniofacial development protein 2 n=1 Tax=Holothuria leucospilota TaxID=206669 RepID=A0A9Q1H2I5_HOLLE|nr:Craniofacial development protein 2 [Holothuria leucospilota]